MKRIAIMILSVALMVSANTSLAGKMPAAGEMPKSFETLKKMVGTWEGKNDREGEDVVVKAIYRLTSGGTAIEQTLMAGTPMEMVTVYHRDGDSLAMTHYCSLGNQPYLSLTKAKDNAISFEMKGTKGITSIKEPHMHGVTLTLSDENSLSEEWVFYQDGKEAKRSTFKLKRVES